VVLPDQNQSVDSVILTHLTRVNMKHNSLLLQRTQWSIIDYSITGQLADMPSYGLVTRRLLDSQTG